MQNVIVVSRSEFHFLSNGALVVGVGLIVCYREMEKVFTETDLAFN
jgi:hypothetical protein